MKFSFVLLFASLTLACGGAAPTPVIVPVQPDAGSAPTANTAPSSSPRVVREKAAGSNGPRDAVGLVGKGAGITSANPETLLFVNGAVIRQRDDAELWKTAITQLLVGWDRFMPVSLIDPVREVDWVIMAGSPLLGSTQKNQILAHYAITEPQAARVADGLMKRIPHARHEKGVELLGEVDGAERAYLRPKAGVLAIVPPDEAAAATTLLKKVDIPETVRPRELLRVIWNHQRRAYAQFIPRAVTALRVWIVEDAEHRLTLAAEGDCADADAAEEAAAGLRATLERAAQSTVVKMMAGPLLARDRVWVDGATLRYDAPLDERFVEIAGKLGCSCE